MFRSGGYASISSPDGLTEADTFSCSHCNRVVHVKAKADPASLGGLCKNCMGLICQTCVGGGCDPFEKKLERAEHRDRVLKSYLR